MKHLKSFIKGIIVGIGGVAPGLSGSVLMVILGLYTEVINAIATLFKDFKKKFIYLLPIGLGMLIGIAIFSRIINYAMENYEIQTRLTFFGLLIGTVPLFYYEVTKNKDTKKMHYLIMGIAFIVGICFLSFFHPDNNAIELNIFESFILGFAGISATIIPGIDGAALLSALGMYGSWLDLTSLNNIDLSVYIPAGIGVVAGAFLLSIIVNKLLKEKYTATFAALFGFFLSIIPSVLKSESGSFISLGYNTSTYIGIFLLIIGIAISYIFGKYNKA